MTDAEQKATIVCELLQQAPPGEFGEVFNDVKRLVGGDAVLGAEVQKAIVQYNMDQLTCAKLPDQQHETIISTCTALEGNRFGDLRTLQTFAFDHVLQQVSDLQPFKNAVSTVEQSELDTAIIDYVEEHYPNGASTVHVKDNVLTVLIVDNKYNPSNFWNGRWRSVWTMNIDGTELQGRVRLHIHYYEDGNVQLTTEKKFKLALSTSTSDIRTSSPAIVKAIKKAEGDYQKLVNESCIEISETTFRLLRRPLPVTKTKVDWNKIANYKIASELVAK